MDYAKPLHPVTKVNEAGRNLVQFLRDTSDTPNKDISYALEIIDNWRAAHNHPLNAFYVTLKNRAKKVSSKAFTAQRIKRLRSIAMKLYRSKAMKLSQMQDIGGCRAVMPSIRDVSELVSHYNLKPINHIRGKDKDYINNPKDTGYRGIHLKYRYNGNGTSAPWDGLKIEIQIRTLLQHKWATAVEAAGTFTDQALKSNLGSAEWLRFFALMSSVFALKEKCPLIPNTPTSYDALRSEIISLNGQYHIQSVFAQYHKIIPTIRKIGGAFYFLITLDPIKRETKIQGYKKEDSQKANAEYTKIESELKFTQTQVVLVQVSNVKALERAYPNYFLDTHDFLKELSEVTGVPV